MIISIIYLVAFALVIGGAAFFMITHSEYLDRLKLKEDGKYNQLRFKLNFFRASFKKFLKKNKINIPHNITYTCEDYIIFSKILNLKFTENILKIKFNHNYEKYKKSRTIKTMDLKFDEKIILHGHSYKSILAALNYKLRNRLLEYSIKKDIKIEIIDKEIKLTSAKRKVFFDVKLIKLLLEIEKRLTDNNPSKLILENLKSEKIIDVKINIFEQLLKNNEIKNNPYFKNYLKNTEDLDLKLIFYLHENDEYNIKHVILSLEESNYSLSKIIKLELLKYIETHNIKAAFPYLTGELKKENSKDIIKKIIKLLAKIGKTKSIEYLLPLTKGFHHPEIKKTAHNTINAIQKDIPKKYRGDLTLTEIESSGKLSIDNSEKEGKLSLEEE